MRTVQELSSGAVGLAGEHDTRRRQSRQAAGPLAGSELRARREAGNGAKADGKLWAGTGAGADGKLGAGTSAGADSGLGDGTNVRPDSRPAGARGSALVTGATLPADLTVRSWAGLGALGALEFLERSRDVASEIVADVAGGEASLAPRLLHW
jgi:hypothetical protein